VERKRVGIVLFDNVEVLDFCGPFEVFSATRLNEEKRREEPSPFEVLLVAEHPEPVIATGNMKVIPHETFEKCPRLDILVVPGGWGTRKELNNLVMLNWMRTRSAEVETLTSVCTGSMLLGFAGLLNGLHATTHWRSLDWMRDSFPADFIPLLESSPGARLSKGLRKGDHSWQGGCNEEIRRHDAIPRVVRGNGHACGRYRPGTDSSLRNR